MDTATTARTALIGLDWGTTSLRAWLFDAQGAVLDTRASPLGIMRLPRPADLGGCDDAFQKLCADWLDAREVPVIAAGMVGSVQGWKEAPYVALPADPGPLARALVPVRSARGSVVHIMPGLIEQGALPNVMRGEETQVLGALVAHASLRRAPRVLLGLPGTHAKWVFVVEGRVERFLTFMTGEVFAALCEHTILGRTMQTGAQPQDEAFLRGVDTARRHGQAGLLATIFSTRTLGLTGQLAPAQQADYLSGLLIGHELMGLAAVLAGEDFKPSDWTPGLIGDAALCRRYRLALAHAQGLDAPVLEHSTEQGLFHIAREAGLLRAQPAGP
ncbi:2-dehydro-3-deoxygalactonokinase [Azohydromonas aeria]|uniref:2-dehydro-3-deoxygalactonokinase n=1 Tax=Azohydromonas aeria TaxID=2590212 RepID=UPI0012F81867|nr:2-dehydro-3-deoxygalactonokinase [Azohydromonas aeria]